MRSLFLPFSCFLPLLTTSLNTNAEFRLLGFELSTYSFNSPVLYLYNCENLSYVASNSHAIYFTYTRCYAYVDMTSADLRTSKTCHLRTSSIKGIGMETLQMMASLEGT